MPCRYDEDSLLDEESGEDDEEDEGEEQEEAGKRGWHSPCSSCVAASWAIPMPSTTPTAGPHDGSDGSDGDDDGGEYADAENVGYAVPSVLLRHVMRDLQHARACSPSGSGGGSGAAVLQLRGMPLLGVRLQGLESRALRAHLGLGPDQTGAWGQGTGAAAPALAPTTCADAPVHHVALPNSLCCSPTCTCRLRCPHHGG